MFKGAQGDSVELSIIEETSFGTTPDDAANWKRVRCTGENLSGEPNGIESEEITGDTRGVRDVIPVGQNVGGDIPLEFSPDSYDDLLAAALGGEWNSDRLVVGSKNRSFTIEKNHTDIKTLIRYTGMVVAGFTLDISPKSIVKGGITFNGREAITMDEPIRGKDITITGTNIDFDSASNTITDNDAGFGSIEAGDEILVSGANLSGNDGFFIVKQKVDSSNIVVDGPILDDVGDTPTIGRFFAATLTSTTAFKSGATIQNVKIDDVIASSTGVAISKIDLAINQEQKSDDVVDDDFATGYSAGQLRPELTLSTYFNDVTLYDKALAGTPFKFSFELHSPADNRWIRFTFPKMKILSGVPDGASRNTSIQFSPQAIGLVDPNDGQVFVERGDIV